MKEMCTALQRAMAEDYCQDDAVYIATNIVQRHPDILRALQSVTLADEAKYKDMYWLSKHVALCHALDLHARQGLRILDLGCGPGWFSWLSGVLGHTPTGLDTPGRPNFYRELCSAMRVPVVDHRINPYEPLPDSLKNYDVIVLLMAAFYSDQRWDNMDSWRFFLKDLDSRLAPGGTILFERNAKYGLHYSAELFDIFTKFGYRMTGRFCVKTENKNIYNAVQRYEHRRNSFADVWFRVGHEGYDSTVWLYIDLLVKTYPKAVDLSVQLAMSKILQGKGESAVSLLEHAVQVRPQRLGYAILLAQLLFARGEREKALAVIQKARRVMPRKALLEAWEQMLRADEAGSVAQISPYWGWACQLLTRSPAWRTLLEERKELADRADPVSWYLRYGTPMLPVAAGFTL